MLPIHILKIGASPKLYLIYLWYFDLLYVKIYVTNWYAEMSRHALATPSISLRPTKA